MPDNTALYGGFEIVVRTELNPRGAWVAKVSLKHGEHAVVDIRPMTVQPEWLNEDEAIRDAVDWARRYIDRDLGAQPPESWVATRSRAENWFRDEQERSRGPDISV